MSKKKFQQGGATDPDIVDEDSLFDDEVFVDNDANPLPGSDDDDDDDDDDDGADDLSTQDGDEDGDGADEDADDDEPEVALTGVEQFLTDFGVQGGLITFEDGSTSRFNDLPAEEQQTVLSSLVQTAAPSTEEKFNLDDTEIDLLNTLRTSGQSPEDFINNLVDYRMQAVEAQAGMVNADYKQMSDDAIFVKSIKEAEGAENITDEEVAEQLSNAKALPSYGNVAEALRKGYINEQSVTNEKITAERNAAFNAELEAQRTEVVTAVESINDIAGAVITDDMKEHLLHDMLELNDNQDPILMERIFSDPEAMLKANWFLQYGEDFMAQTNNYWKGKVSEAKRIGYEMATGQMPTSPSAAGQGRGKKPAGGKKPAKPVAAGEFGEVVSEDDLFND